VNCPVLGLDFNAFVAD